MKKEPVVHLSPVWKDKANFLIFASIEGSEEKLVRDLEQLWVRQISESEFEVCCVPFFTYGIALGDTVRSKSGLGKKYLIDSATSCSGRQVLRLNYERTTDLTEKDKVLQKLREVGCVFEWYSEYLLAVDSPNQNVTTMLESLFKSLEERGLAKYEFGH